MPIEKERSEKVRREIWQLSKVKRSIEKEKPNRKDLLRQCEAQVYDWRGHAETWRNLIAEDLNKVLGQCEYSLVHDPGVDLEWVCASLRVVARVAEFEGIRRVKS